MLVSTDVAAMGLDVADLNLSINIGIENIAFKWLGGKNLHRNP